MKKLALHGGKPVRKEMIPYGRQCIDDQDIQAVINVLESPYLTTGPNIDAFEQKLCSVTRSDFAVAISNGTSALHAACYAAGVGPGDEVIVTPITFAASANCVLYLGGKPVFADINEKTWNIDPREVENNITDNTKAVIAVDFAGQVVAINELKDICQKHNLTLIEDAAHSLGSKYNGKPVGSLADITTMSFHPVKTITTGEGGAVLTNDAEYFNKIKLFRSHGITRDPELLSCRPYNGYNEQIELGYNYRMTDMQAALGISQLSKLNAFTKRRKEIVNIYNEAFSSFNELSLQYTILESDTVNHLYVLRIKPELLNADRNEIYAALNAENIGLQVHYLPVYRHPYYQRLGYPEGLCPKAEKLSEEIFSIPLYYSMTNEDVQSVIDAVTKVIRYYKK